LASNVFILLFARVPLITTVFSCLILQYKRSFFFRSSKRFDFRIVSKGSGLAQEILMSMRVLQKKTLMMMMILLENSLSLLLQALSLLLLC